ncbi:hypothetical protein O181_034674 [Austropuccinia psidii MF-1]|uniref:DUF654-domain-containing protein n=1 Tax=Austropuccinia psidii MF-1 TaxID=1389203 RepID=A0A9Q3D174_9BASI|nr:hypothetical protein [Austropuccinia psidii MF-1]
MVRSSRRQKRENEELQNLAFSTQEIQQDDDGKSSSDDHLAQTASDIVLASNLSNKFSTFSDLLNDSESSQEENVEDESIEPIKGAKANKSKKKKSKKKSKNKSNLEKIQQQAVDSPSGRPTLQSVGSKSKASKTAKATCIELDEIDAALEDLKSASHFSTSVHASSSTKSLQPPSHAINNLLAIDGRSLDPEIELRKMFGAKVVSSSFQNNTSNLAAYYGTRISNNPHHHLNYKSKATLLAKALPNWPKHHGDSSGLSMKSMFEGLQPTGPTSSHELWFSFEHAPSFRLVQSKFIAAILSLDPNQLISLLHIAPYHPDTLLQLSEIAGEQGDPGQALDFLNRALYGFEKSFHPSYNLCKGDCRLDFQRVENRSFFRAIEKKLQLLMKRGCWRTAFETGKLLFALNPYQDPYGALLWLDFLAPKAKQYQYFLDLLSHLADLQNRDLNGGIYTEAYPGLYYSKALCLRALEETETLRADNPSSFALESAILRFPQVIIPLAQAIEVDVPSTFHWVPRATPQTSYGNTVDNLLHLQAQIYVLRASSLWKEVNTRIWLQMILNRCHAKLVDPKDPDVILGEEFSRNNHHPIIPDGIYRTVFVSDVQSLKKFLPSTVSNTDSYSFDPFPPKDGTFYDETYFENMSSAPTPARSRQHNRIPQVNAPLHEIGRRLWNAIPIDLEAMAANAEIQNRDIERANEIEQLQIGLQAEIDFLEPMERQELLDRLHAILGQAQPNNNNNADQDAGLGTRPRSDTMDDQLPPDTNLEDTLPSNHMPGAFLDEEWFP